MTEEFIEAEEFWFLDKLYEDLAVHKMRALSRTEKLHLRGLLSGFSPNQIALKINRDVEGIQTALSKTIYTYTKLLVGKSVEEKIDNWRCIPQWLEEKSYRKPLQHQAYHLPIDNLDAIVKLVSGKKVSIHDNAFAVEINISFQTVLPLTPNKNNAKIEPLETEE